MSLARPSTWKHWALVSLAIQHPLSGDLTELILAWQHKSAKKMPKDGGLVSGACGMAQRSVCGWSPQPCQWHPRCHFHIVIHGTFEYLPGQPRACTHRHVCAAMMPRAGDAAMHVPLQDLQMLHTAWHRRLDENAVCGCANRHAIVLREATGPSSCIYTYCNLSGMCKAHRQGGLQA